MDFCQVFLVEADQLPPGHAGDEDEEDVKRHHAEVDLVEARALEVTLTEVTMFTPNVCLATCEVR